MPTVTEIKPIKENIITPIFTALPPLSLYIHFPWCIEKCPYCDFNSHEIKSDMPANDYIDCLLLDLENELPNIWGRTISTIFMGGGTPSLFPAESIERLMQGLRSRLNISPDIEVTLEANPGTVDQSQFIGFRQAGINRLSMGIQSFNDSMLKKLGRIHNSIQAINAIEAAHKSGFNSFNIDLMFGLPNQSIELMQQDLQTAIDFQPPHLSHYQLTIEPNTLFAAKPPTVPNDDILWGMTQHAHTLLAANNYQQYEVSAFAKQHVITPTQCKHNVNYWQFGDYIGIGAGAHQKISYANTQTIERCYKQKHPKTYMQDVKTNKHVLDKKTLTSTDIVFEFMLNALRLTKGFDTSLFRQHSGLDLIVIQPILDIAVDKKWLTQSNSLIKATPLGNQYLNDLMALFLPD